MPNKPISQYIICQNYFILPLAKLHSVYDGISLPAQWATSYRRACQMLFGI
ncbi:MAG: hypothetical protein HFE34_01340 [Clostridia bacterium]|nr:hypothetical protein [Clostridia bacterium]